ncbi:MAG TPA: transcription-repair coupling factor [Alphaproteobacteria bacterium]
MPLQHGKGTIYGVPEGEDARYLITLARESFDALRQPVLHIAVSDERAAMLQELLAFFDSGIAVHYLPAWDCLPYDRASPQPDILAARARFLVMVAQHEKIERPTIILTVVNAATQRLPDPSLFAGASLTLEKGGTVKRDKLQKFFSMNGYTRADTVREIGEFAIRGGIIDLFPASEERPIRLDMFDDEIEGMKYFDALTQGSAEPVDRIELTPLSELLLNPDNITRFRQGYREHFGVGSDDPLFEAVSAGHRYVGMEHWLPLFYPKLVTLFDLYPHAPVSADHHWQGAWGERLKQITDFYQARTDTAATQKGPSYKPLPSVLMYLTAEEESSYEQKRAIWRDLSPFAMPPADEAHGIARDGKATPRFHTKSGPSYDDLKAAVTNWQHQKRKVVIACYTTGSRERVQTVLSDHGMSAVQLIESYDDIKALKGEQIGLCLLGLEHGFIAADMVVLTEQDIFGDRLGRVAKKGGRKAQQVILQVGDLSNGDLVVHREHGVGKFEGLITLTVDGQPHDCLKIIYADEDKLFVPVENIDVLTRFGSEHSTTQLDRLGGAAWQARKARVKKRLLDMAEGLIALAAKRHIDTGPTIEMPEAPYHEFVARFPYQETDDQERAIGEVMDDLQRDRAMDRLICGDVGFGKTEVAMRAAFVAAMAGLQVAVVVPTTLLSRQHTQNFLQRFAGFPLRIAQLSRFVTATESNRVKDQLENGQVDIVIGTHALLSNSIKFSNLGLMIVDEEQNFGVKQKEKLKELKHNVHVLTLTATPIPRTLQLSMSGIREMSIIATPPIDRLAVRTFVLPYDQVIIREAILREYYRGGQCFYVCPRLSDMDGLKEQLAELVPEVRVIEAHGQLPADELDRRMTDFYEGKYHVLLATNIIESGLDIANANTLIVHRADMFGLSQLYQIRGRVGRSKRRGYAYFTYKNDKLLTEQAKQRLHVIGTLDTLGAGFQLASYDMDIRGAGNLLGEEQSGQIREVGVELYQEMLAEAVQMAKLGDSTFGETIQDNDWVPQINLGVPVLIPEEYVRDLPVRLGLYRRLASLTEHDAIEAFAVELIDRFGPLPDEVKNLLDVMTIKQLCKHAGIEKIDAGPRGALLSFRRNQFAAVDQLLVYVNKQLGTIKIRPDQKLSAMRTWDEVSHRITGVRQLVRDLSDMVA